MFKRVENGFSTWMLFSLTRKIPLYSIVEKPLKRTPSYFTPILHGPFTAATSYRAGTPQTIPLNTTYPSSIIPPRPPIKPTKRHETSIQNRTLAVPLSSAVAVPGSSYISRRLYTKLLRTGQLVTRSISNVPEKLQLCEISWVIFNIECTKQKISANFLISLRSPFPLLFYSLLVAFWRHRGNSKC